MTAWSSYPFEERNLLNPAFCSVLLWQAAYGYDEQIDPENSVGLPFELGFVVLPIVLHKPTREKLPRTAKTSLPVWLERNPLVRSQIAARATALVPFTKDAIKFGGIHALVALSKGRIVSNLGYRKKINKCIKQSSDEVERCANRATFVGKWFSKSGTSRTVLAFLGLRP